MTDIKIHDAMTPEQRTQAFRAMFLRVPDEPRGERVRTVAKWLLSEENTVRIWSMASPPRIPSAAKLKLFHRELALRNMLR